MFWVALSRAGDDVHPRLEPYAGHADGLADAVLAVDDEVLGQHMQYLLVRGDADGASRVDDPLHVTGGASSSWIATTPGSTRLLTNPPAMPVNTEWIWQPAMSSASATARWMDCTVDSMFTTFTPFFRPRRMRVDAHDLHAFLRHLADDGHHL